MSTVASIRRIDEHDSDHGFCTVCGAVWPCSRARRAELSHREPATRHG